MITSTAVSEGRPPRRSAMPMAIGVVTDFGASESSVARLAPNRAADGDGRQGCGQGTDDQRDQQGQRQAHQASQLGVERNGQRHGGRPEQEMHELCAVEVGAVGRVGQRQQGDQGGDREQHRVGQWMPAATLVHPGGALVGEQGQRQAKQGRRRQVDPDLADARRHGVSCGRSRWRLRKRSTRAVTAMVISVLATSETSNGSHSSDMRWKCSMTPVPAGMKSSERCCNIACAVLRRSVDRPATHGERGEEQGHADHRPRDGQGQAARDDFAEQLENEEQGDGADHPSCWRTATSSPAA
jgi:hypothetical protein